MSYNREGAMKISSILRNFANQRTNIVQNVLFIEENINRSLVVSQYLNIYVYTYILTI